jgi:hypothetical protein
MLFNNIETHSRLRRPTPTWSFDYKKCTIAELCKFFEERTGTVLNEAQLQKVRDHGSYPLIDRLREMDRERTFPRFMELPPELRIGVYEALLVTAAGNNKHRGMPSIHTAVLRTSRQVYSEARPVLYKRNKFWAVVRHAEAGSRHSGAPIVGCSLQIAEPGESISLSQRTPRLYSNRSLLHRLLQDSLMDMLRALTHITVDLDLTIPGNQEIGDYAILACDAITALCLSMCGVSKLEELTINVKGGGAANDTDLAHILWPLLFLRTNVVVKFQGISAVRVTELVDVRMSPQEEASFAGQIAHVRRLCSAEIEKRGWKESGWLFDGVREVETALDDVSFVGKGLIRLDDIVKLSAVWKRLQGEADRVEAENSEQEG